MANLSTIKSASRYQEVYNRGIKVKRPFFISYLLTNEEQRHNYGFVASKKIGGAVKRNRAKRLLREACRSAAGASSRPAADLFPKSREGYDIILVSRSAINGAGFQEVYRQWASVLADLKQRCD